MEAQNTSSRKTKLQFNKGDQQRSAAKVDKRKKVSVKIISDAGHYPQSDTQSPLTVAETPKTSNLKSRHPSSSGKKKLKLKRNCSILGDSSRGQHMISSESPEGKRYSQHLSFEGVLNSERTDQNPSRTNKQQARITQILDSRPTEDSASVQTRPLQKLLIQSSLKPEFDLKQSRPTSSDQQNLTVKEFLELKIKQKFDGADTTSRERRPTASCKQNADLDLVQSNPTRVTQSESPPSVADLNQDTDQKKEDGENDLSSVSANQIRLELAKKPIVINNSKIVPATSILEGTPAPYQMVTRNFNKINTDVNFSVSQDQPKVLCSITKKGATPFLNTRSRSSFIADQPELKARVSNSTVASSCHSMKPRSRSGVPQFIKIKKVQRQHSADSSTPLHPHISIKKQISEDHSPGSLTLFNNPTFKFKTHHCHSTCQCQNGQAKSLSNTSRRIPMGQKPPLSQCHDKPQAEAMTHQASLSSGIGAISSKPPSMNCHKIKFKRREKGSESVDKENNLNLQNYVGYRNHCHKDGSRNMHNVKELLSSYKADFTCPKPSPSKFLSSQTPNKGGLRENSEKKTSPGPSPSPIASSSSKQEGSAQNLQSLYSYKSKTQIIIKQLIKIFIVLEEAEKTCDKASDKAFQPSKIKQYTKSLTCIFTSLGKAHHMASAQAKPLGQVLLQVNFAVLLLLRLIEDNTLPSKSGAPIKIFLQASISTFTTDDAEARGQKLSNEVKKLLSTLQADFKKEDLSAFLAETLESLNELTSLANTGLTPQLDKFLKLVKFKESLSKLQSASSESENTPKKEIRRKLTDDLNPESAPLERRSTLQPQGQVKIQKISISKLRDSSKDFTNLGIIQFSANSPSKGAAQVSECHNPTESILRQAKNKYYLKREHLKQHSVAPTQIVDSPVSKPPTASKGKVVTPKKKKFLPSPETTPEKEEKGIGSSSRKRYTLVLDLDETLVHFDGAKSKFKLRPGCIGFLRDMSALFEVVIFTAAQKGYADFILNQIEALAAQQASKEAKKRAVIDHRLYRQNCEEVDGVYVKDLSNIGRDLSRTIIVDNIRDNFERQKDNGIEILTWIDNSEDRELSKLAVFLTQVAKSGVDDVREHVKTYTREVWKCQSPSKRDLSRFHKKARPDDEGPIGLKSSSKRLITPVRAMKTDLIVTPPPASNPREGTLNTSSSEKNVKKKDIFNDKAQKIIPIRSSPFHIEKHPSKIAQPKLEEESVYFHQPEPASRTLIHTGILNSTAIRQKELGLSPPKRSSKLTRFSGTPQKPLICSPQIEALLSGAKPRDPSIRNSQTNISVKNGTFDSNKQAFEVLQLSSAKKQANRRQSLNSDIFTS